MAGFLLALSFAPLIGCLAPDNTPLIQVVPRLVVAPQNLYFKAINYIPFSQPPSGSLQAFWNRSTADTQLNFKGYFVELCTSNIDEATGNDTVVSLIDTATIFRIGGAVDTTYTFSSNNIGPPKQGISLGRYTLVLHSGRDTGILRNGKIIDSLLYSIDSSEYSAYYDPRTLRDPAFIWATSVGPNSVDLRWTLSPQDKANYLGFYQYVVYCKDTTVENDSGHIAAVVRKGVDSVIVSINGPVIAGSSGATTEYPFRYWVKSERIDSTFFNGTIPGIDSNCITWAGAQAVPVTPNDSGVNSGYRKIIHSMYFGSYGPNWDVVDSAYSGSQIGVVVNNGTVTLYDSNGSNFIESLSGGAYDTAASLTSIFYTRPMRTLLGASSIALPQNTTDSGVIVYLQMPDNTNTPALKGSHWARIFIRNQGNGSFINQATGGIDIKASYQVGVSKDGSTNLFYY